MTVEEMPEMPSRKLSVGWLLLSMMFGLTTCTQPVPSKCSIRVCKTGGLGTVSVVNPTAQILVGDKVRRPLLASALSLLPGLGVEIVLNVELQAGKACGAAERRGPGGGLCTGRGSGKGSACSSSCAAQSSGGDLLEAFPRSRVCGNASE